MGMPKILDLNNVKKRSSAIGVTELPEDTFAFELATVNYPLYGQLLICIACYELVTNHVITSWADCLLDVRFGASIMEIR